MLGRFQVQYFRCPECEYWCTEDPYWLDEAYASAISALDTGILERNTHVAILLTALLPKLRGNGPYVDWAGGLGILVRMMRDRGFDFYWQDDYSTNELARGFEWSEHMAMRHPPSCITGIEVLEHVIEPMAFVRRLFDDEGTSHFVFSQLLHDEHTKQDWWYFLPETGQHVSFFSARTLSVLAERLGLSVAHFDGLHVLSREPIRISRASEVSIRLRIRAAKLILPRTRHSMLSVDHEALKGRVHEATWPDSYPDQGK